MNSQPSPFEKHVDNQHVMQQIEITHGANLVFVVGGTSLGVGVATKIVAEHTLSHVHPAQGVVEGIGDFYAVGGGLLLAAAALSKVLNRKP